MSRRQSRERALQVLFSLEFQTVSLEVLKQEIPSLSQDFLDDSFCWALVTQLLEKKPQIDILLEQTMKKWKISRLAVVDRTILRLGVLELISQSGKAIVINEYVDLAKKYGSTESGAFVNGVLDAISVLPHNQN